MNEEKTLKDLRILYVEDEAYLREEIGTYLRRRVGKLVLAEDGAEGIKAFQNGGIDLIITDLKMPNMDGLQMSREIRNLGSDIPILITTAISDVELMQESIEIGIERYLLKPIDVNALITALESVKKKLQKQSISKAFSEIDYEQIKGYERKIEAEMAKLIKQTTGKGPQRVTCQFTNNMIEIIIKDSRTILEGTLLETEENKRIVDYIRETYYQQLKKDVQKKIRQITDYHVVWLSLVCDSAKDEDRLKFMLDI